MNFVTLRISHDYEVFPELPGALPPFTENPRTMTPDRRQFCLSATMALAAGAFPLRYAQPSTQTASSGVATQPVPKPVPDRVPELGKRLSDAQAAQIAQLALSGIDREYPNKPNQVLRGPDDILSPKQLHPAFFGCFDWHSSVHGHWVLAHLLRHYPAHSLSAPSRQKLSASLSTANLLTETRYFDSKENRSFERMYGWAWLLQLVTELHPFDDPDAQQWRNALRPLEEKIVELTVDYLPRLSFPIRTGVHPDTAFALGLTIDYAKAVGNESLLSQVLLRARDYYLRDQSANAAFEPSGEDFFSPTLNEADLMRRVLSPDEFAAWLPAFLPELFQHDSAGNPVSSSKLLQPVEVSDVTDGKLVHLAGLDFSRAWCMLGIARSLPDNNPLRTRLLQSAQDHARVGFQYVFSGHYEGEHWLGTFALFALAASQ